MIQRILEDSKVVIGWEKGETQLYPTHIHFWKQHVFDLIKNNIGICFEHIYREYKTMTNALLKYSMSIP